LLQCVDAASLLDEVLAAAGVLGWGEIAKARPIWRDLIECLQMISTSRTG
jgi:arginine exporter protein ArgO